MLDKNALHIYTITQFTKDYKREVICRRHQVSAGKVEAKEVVVRADSVEECRQKLNEKVPGLHCLGRVPNDDPVIVESWV
jgi:hypothetical protein